LRNTQEKSVEGGGGKNPAPASGKAG